MLGLSRPRLLAFAAALPALLLAVILRWRLEGVLGSRALYSTYFPAVMLAAYFGGFWPGLIVTFIAGIATHTLADILDSRHFEGPGEFLALGLFLFTGTIISALSESLHRARRRIVSAERMRAREELNEEMRRVNERLELAVRGTNVAVFDIDMPDGDVLNSRHSYVNVWEQLGYNGAPDSATTAREMIHPDDLAKWRLAAQHYVAGDTGTFETEVRMRHRDGSYRTMLSRGASVRDAAGKPVRMVGINIDISELKRIQEALRQARDTAEAANRAKDEFLANVSHEIRTPMNAILGMTELTLESRLTDDQRQCLTTVKSAADNLLGMIDDLLDFSKIEAGKMELSPVAFSLRGVLGDTLGVLSDRACRKGLNLTSRVENDVPDGLTGDAGRLRQILLNIVGNAIKFTESGGVTVDVRVADDAAPRPNDSSAIQLQFRVSDTGIGIPSDKQARIFRAFEQQDSSTTRKYGGTGLGLAISSRLVELMDGQISLESRPGFGSTFAFSARFARRSSAKDAGRREQGGARETPAAAGLHVLVAEDNEFNVQLMQQLLTRRGHRIRVAKNGREALALALSDEFDLLLLDVHMPEMDGYQLARALREHEARAGNAAHLPVIALTASARSEDRERCLAAGMDEFIAKPIRQAQLWEAIERVTRAAPRRPTDASPPMPPGSPHSLRSDAEQLIDASVVLAACGGDEMILERLCKGLQDHLPQQLSAIESALDAGDAARLFHSAHKLCGMISAFSTRLANIASTIEDHANDSRPDLARPLVDQLAVLSRELIQQTRGLSVDQLQSWIGIQSHEP